MLKKLCDNHLVDYVAMDIKNSRYKYGKAIGKNVLQQESIIDKVQESARYLMNGSVDYEFRTTLVKGIHEVQDIADIVDWIAGAKIWYLQNYKDSGSILSPNSCKMESFSENELELFEKTAKEHEINVVVRNV